MGIQTKEKPRKIEVFPPQTNTLCSRPACLSGRRGRSQLGIVSNLLAFQCAAPRKHDLFGPVTRKIEANHGVMQIVIIQGGKILSCELFERFQCAADRAMHI